MKGVWRWLSRGRDDRERPREGMWAVEEARPQQQQQALARVRGEVVQLCTQRLRQLRGPCDSGAVPLAAAAMEALVFERHWAADQSTYAGAAKALLACLADPSRRASCQALLLDAERYAATAPSAAGNLDSQRCAHGASSARADQRARQASGADDSELWAALKAVFSQQPAASAADQRQAAAVRPEPLPLTSSTPGLSRDTACWSAWWSASASQASKRNAAVGFRARAGAQQPASARGGRLGPGGGARVNCRPAFRHSGGGATSIRRGGGSAAKAAGAGRREAAARPATRAAPAPG